MDANLRRLQAELSRIDATLKRLHWDIRRADRLASNGHGSSNGHAGMRVRAVTPAGVVEVAQTARAGPGRRKGARRSTRRRSAR